MLDVLNEVIAAIPKLIAQPDAWDSLVINRRKPVTHRAFASWRGYRVCLHRFETCDEQESLFHPHPWPGAFAIVRGSYEMAVGFSKDRHSRPDQVMRTLMVPGSRYEIVDPRTWHAVIPREECFTIMVNGEAWPTEVAHMEVRRTGGKSLCPMSASELQTLFDAYRDMGTGARGE